MRHSIESPEYRLLSSSTLGLVVIAAAIVGGGCGKICNDDGFAWQQDELCQVNASATTTESESDTETATTTDSATATVSASATMTTTLTTGMSETSGGGTTYCEDNDNDGFGDPDACTDVPMGDEPPPGTVPNDDDCDDSNPNTFPGAAELDDPVACMEDDDDDGHGDANPGGGGGGGGGPVPGSDECDENPYAWMEATCATCNDNDMDGYWAGCDVYPDPNSPDPRNPDFGDQFADCNDADNKTFPGAAPKDDPIACMKDADDDDYGDDFGGMMPPPGVTPGSDCDDANDHTFPGSAPLDDPDACMQDNDDDDHGDAKPDKPGVVVGSDCFDDNPALSPSKTRLMTAPASNSGTANVSEIVAGDGVYDVVEYMSFEAGTMNWQIESVTVDPITTKVWGWLEDVNGRGLVELDYCGGAPPMKPSNSFTSKRVCGITFNGAGRFFGVDYSLDQFLEFSIDDQNVPKIETVKPLTYNGASLNIAADCGLTYDCFNDRLILADAGTMGFYSIDPDTGEATLLSAPQAEFGSGLALDPVAKVFHSCLGTTYTTFGLDDFAMTQLDPLSVASVNDLEYLPICQ